MTYAQQVKRYVIATVDSPTMYLKSLHWGKYEFTENIMECTKTVSRKLADDMKKYYRADTGDDLDLVVIPLVVTYELIDESEQGTQSNSIDVMVREVN